MLVTGSIKSIIHGVSTQSPRERIPGQCWSLVNFIPDPIDGLVRRPGCKHEGAGHFASAGAYTWADMNIGGTDYFVGCAAGNIKVINASTGVAADVWQAASSVTYFANGIKASASVGDYVVAASDVKPEIADIPGESNRAPASRYFCMIEVKQGVFGGIYRVVRKSTGAVLASFTMPNGSTATDIDKGQPQYIAQQLHTALAALGGADSFTTVKSTNGVISLEASTEAYILDLAVDDGAYNSRMRLVYNYWLDTASLPTVAPDSLIVRIGRIDKSLGDFYMKFDHTTPVSDYLTPRTGRWNECAAPGLHDGGSLVTTTMPRLIRLYSNKVYIGTGPEIKSQVLADTGDTLVDINWGSRTIGDADSNGDPLFVGKTIKWMGTFQDRLVIVSDNAVTMSRISDYLELYLSTVVSILDDDAVNMSSTFNEKDVLTGASLHDRNLLVLGTKTHYMIPGKVPVTPQSGMAVTAAYESSPTVHPVLFGDGVYFCSVSAVNADILCIQTKDLIDSTQVNSVASHVDGWLPGDISKLAAAPKMDMMFALSASGDLYCYRTKFLKRERALSSWFKFQFASSGAKLVSLVVDNTRLRLMFTRTISGTVYYEVASLDLDRKGYLATTGQYYLDFWKIENVASGDTVLTDDRAKAVLDTNYSVINPTTGTKQGSAATVGGNTVCTMPASITSAITGQMSSYEFIPTLPIARDRDGNPTALGKMTIGQFIMSYSWGSRFDIRVVDQYRDAVREHRASRVGTSTSVLGQAYIGAGKAVFPVGTAETDAKVIISGSNHFPLVFTYIDWKGQYFKHGRGV
jgi:hypothetical protein